MCLHIHVYTPIYICIYTHITYLRTYLTYLLTYLLIPWSSILLEKLIGSHLVKKFPTFMAPEGSLPHSQQPSTCPYHSISPCTRLVFRFRNKSSFYGEEFSAPRPTPKLDHPLSTVRDCLFNIFAATLHMGGRSSIRNLRTPHSEVTGTHLSHIDILAK